MRKDILLQTIERDCPLCNEIHSIELRKRLTQAVIKDETVEYEEMYFLCPFTDEQENEFVPAGMMDENLLKARDAYRAKKRLLTSEEIAEIRGFYGLSQSDFSALLGWGEVTITRYESKTIQDETYDNLMRMARVNPMFALESLERHKERFKNDKYKNIRNNVIEKIEKCGNLYLKKQEIRSLYISYQEESEYNGYKQLDIEKLANVIGYFSHFANNLYKVKLMKLLWYADALHLKRYGRSMTGLVYKHMPYGALPIAYDEIIYLPTVKVVEEIIYEDISYRIVPNKEVNLSDFTLEELGVLEKVATTFRDYKSKDIVEYMHSEKAYIETEEYQIIPFGLAKELKELE